MRYSLLFLFGLAYVSSFSQQIQERKVEPFEGITASGPVEVEIRYGDQQLVSITTPGNEDVSNLTTKVKNGVLTIGSDKGNYQDKNIKVLVVTSKIEEIKVRTGARVKVPELPNNKDACVSLTVIAGGLIWFRAEHKAVEARVSQGGNITLFGSAQILDAAIATGGTIAGYHCKAETVHAAVKAGGDLFCQPIEFLSANIFSGGSIYYFGKPKSMTDKIKLGGKILQIDALPEFEEK